MIFFILFISSYSIYVGIDAGAAYTKSSIVSNPEVIEIGRDCANKQLTPTFIGFRAKPQFKPNEPKYVKPDEAIYLTPDIGEKALKIMEARPIMGMGYFPDLIELNETYKPERAAELGTGTNASRVEFHDTTALFYKMYIDCISRGKKISDIAIVVPAKYLFLQRYQFQAALRTIGFENVHVIDDTNAVAYVYANEKSSKFSRGAKNTLFIDLGATSFKAYVMRFSHKLSASGHISLPFVQRYSYQIDYSTGGVFITQSIAKYLLKKLRIETKNDAEKQRVYDAAEKVKKILSSEKDATVIVNEIGGIDRTFEMTTEELEKNILNPFVESAINVALNASKGHKIDHIEFIGGSSHNDYLVEHILNGLNYSIKSSDDLASFRTLNPDHCLSRGAGYFLQFISDSSRFPTVEITEPSSIYNITLITMSGTFPICDLGQQCKKRQIIPGNSSIILFEYGTNEARQGIAKYSFGFFVDNITSSIEISFSSLPFSLYDIQTCNRTGCHRLELQFLMYPDTPSRVFEMFISSDAQEERIKEIRKKITETAEKVLHDVEKNKTFRFFTNYTQRLEIIRAAEAARKWLKEFQYRDGVNLANFSIQLELLEEKSKPVYDRISENSTFIKSLNMFYHSLKMAKDGIEKEWPKEKPFLDKRTLDRFKQLVNETEEWFNKSLNLTRNTPPYLPRPVKGSEFEDKGLKLYDWYGIVDSIERKKKRTGRKIENKEKVETKDEKYIKDEDDEDEKHNPEYEYVDMNDEEMEAYYAQTEWVDPFLENEKVEKPKSLRSGIEDFKLSKQARHMMNKRLKQMEEEERLKNQTKKNTDDSQNIDMESNKNEYSDL